jgi:hypothetical protein
VRKHLAATAGAEWQDEMVALFKKIVSAKRLQEEIARGLDAFLPAILDKAFRGEC